MEDIRYESLTRAGAKKQEYYVLRPAVAPTCTTYVPTGNEKLTSKMRHVMTKDEIDEMICSVKGQKLEWIEETRQRTDAYTQVLSQGITGELLKLIGCLYLEKKARSKSGKKFCATDEKILSSAERMISEEFAYALQIPTEAVSSYIAEKMDEETM